MFTRFGRVVALMVAFALMGAVTPAAILAQTPAPFVTEWETGGFDGDKVKILLYYSPSYNFTIDWGDGSDPETFTKGENIFNDPSHTYSSEGTYVITITPNEEGGFPGIAQGSSSFARGKILTIQQWGDAQWERMDQAFKGEEDMTHTASDTPDLSNVTDMSKAFKDASSFNGDIGDWDVSNVTDMRQMFTGASSFNADIGDWDVSKVQTMEEMFFDARNFNQDLSGWEVSNVTNMLRMFAVAEAFNNGNQPLNDWDVSNVERMDEMFRNAKNFNQPIGRWDVSSVTDMREMFTGAEKFNQPIGDWDVSNVTDMGQMFRGASSFNQPIGDWDVSSVTKMTAMFAFATAFDQDLSGWDVTSVDEFKVPLTGGAGFLAGTSLSPAKYDALLKGWSRLNLETEPSNEINVDVSSQYTDAAAAARAQIESEYEWNFYDNGETPAESVSLTESTPPSFTLRAESEDLPVGQFGVKATTDNGLDPYVQSLILSLSGENRGVDSIKVWHSQNDTFEKSQDTEIGAVDTDAAVSAPSTVPFYSLDPSVLPQSETYIFVTVDLADFARGDLQVRLGDSEDLALAGANLQNASEDFPKSLGEAAVPAAAEVALQSGDLARGLTPGTEANPIGRARLSVTEDYGFNPLVQDLTVTLGGDNQGVEAVSVWRSSDDSFNKTEDGRLGTVNVDPSTSVPSSVSFTDLSGLDLTDQGTHVFVTADLTDAAEGAIQAELGDSTDLKLVEGNLQTPSDDFPQSLGGVTVSGPPAPEAAAVALQSGDLARGLTPGTEANPIGRARLSVTEDYGFNPLVQDLTVTLGGDNQGVEAVSVWRSSDDSFNKTEDGRLGTVNVDPSTSVPSSVSFTDLSGLDLTDQGTHVFVTADLTDAAEGAIQAELGDSTDLKLVEGNLQTQSDDFPQSLGGVTVSGSPVPEAAAVALQSGDLARSLTPGTEAKPIGRARLRTVKAYGFTPSVQEVTVTLGGDNQGVDAIELWRSSDDTFEARQDGKIGSVGVDPKTATPSTVSFSDLPGPVLSQDDTYLFVTADVTAEAEGDIQASLSNSTDLDLLSGNLQTPSDAFPQSLGTGTVLLVDLTPTDGGVQVNVQTSAAQNIDQFEVQRNLLGSADEWVPVNTITVNGNSSSSKRKSRSYSFKNNDVPYEADSVAYRVKVKEEGTTYYSDPVTVRRDVNELQLLGTFPNPAPTRATVRYAVPEDADGTVRIHLYDIMGRRVRTVTQTTETGRRKQNIDVSGLASGIYFLRLTDGDATRTQKMTVVR